MYKSVYHNRWTVGVIIVTVTRDWVTKNAIRIESETESVMKSEKDPEKRTTFIKL